MELSQTAASITVHNDQPLRLQNGFGRRITVLEGNVWVTQDGDPRDVVLRAGDDFRFDRPVAAIVSALGGDARIVRQDGVDISPSGGQRQNRFKAALSRLWETWRDSRRAMRARASFWSMSGEALADVGVAGIGCRTKRHD